MSHNLPPMDTSLTRRRLLAGGDEGEYIGRGSRAKALAPRDGFGFGAGSDIGHQRSHRLILHLQSSDADGL